MKEEARLEDSNTAGTMMFFSPKGILRKEALL
jgi:hypothetical protein